MTVQDFITLYSEDSLVKTLAGYLKPNERNCIQLKGLKGSLDAVITASLHRLNKQTSLFVMHDREEAAYFVNDLQSLVPGQEILLFPSSFKRPYQFDETENANILMRAEILSRINQQTTNAELIVTYPEALTEKVINRRSLRDNTFTARTGESVDTEFLAELLQTYDFERTDFVYEAGQFAVRGGIIDVFSYANELPYRIELFGDEIESIRTFDPVSQLSVDPVEQISIIPNVQTHLLTEERQSLLEFMPKETKIFFKDYQQTLDVLDKSFEKASQSFDTLMQQAGNTQVVSKPELLFETAQDFTEKLQPFSQVEFGNRFYLQPDHELSWEAEPQPSFNKNFELIVKSLEENSESGIINIMVAESAKQIERLTTIFEEIDPYLKFQGLNIALREGYLDKILKIACYTDHQLFDRFHKYRSKSKYSKSKALTLKELRSLQPGDFVTHVDHGIGKFAGLEKIENNGKHQEAMRLIYRDDDLVLVSIHSLHKISKYTGKEGTPPQISKLGSQDWENKKKRVKKK